MRARSGRGLPVNDQSFAATVMLCEVYHLMAARETSAEMEAAGKVPEPEQATPIAGDPTRWVEEYGDALYGFAWMRLRDKSKAEDLVQETFLAALANRAQFAGRSAEKSWLIGILKHKIHDYYRKAARETSFTDLTFFAEDEAEQFIADGLSAGAWTHGARPAEWMADPRQSLENTEFWVTLHACTERLPAKIAQAFLLREMDEVESKDICSMLSISEANLWVMLHRARSALRRCLENNWFKERS